MNIHVFSNESGVPSLEFYLQSPAVDTISFTTSWSASSSGILGVHENLFKFMVAFLDFKILARCFGDRGGRVTHTAVKLKTENSGEENESD